MFYNKKRKQAKYTVYQGYNGHCFRFKVFYSYKFVKEIMDYLNKNTA